MKKSIFASSLILAACLGTVPAQADDLTVSTSIDYVTDYVFRGVSLADSAVQPGAELGFGDFTTGAWFSTGIGETSIAAADELDLYMGYGLELSDAINASVGVTYYHYPQGGGLFETNDGVAGSYEIYGGLAFDRVLSPSVTAYYDLTLEALTLEAGIGHSLTLDEAVALELGLTAGHVDGEGFSYEYGQGTATLSYELSDDVAAYISGNYALSSEDSLDYKKLILGNPKDNLLFFGAGISAGF